MMSKKTSEEKAEQEKISIGLSNFLHLFDEQWFFFNTLNGDLAVTKKSVHEEPKTTVKIEKMDSFSTRQEEETGPRLRYSYSSMDDPVQQSLSSLSSSKTYTEQNTGKQRPPRTERPHRRCANPHLLLCWEARNRKAFQSKKWRSLGDLETMELQGFKDLGFVFDERKEEEEDGGKKRLYLPEGWFAQSSAPAVALRRVGCWSGEEMKEQLRFWARAVACNVRRDC